MGTAVGVGENLGVTVEAVAGVGDGLLGSAAGSVDVADRKSLGASIGPGDGVGRGLTESADFGLGVGEGVKRTTDLEVGVRVGLGSVEPFLSLRTELALRVAVTTRTFSTT